MMTPGSPSTVEVIDLRPDWIRRFRERTGVLLAFGLIVLSLFSPTSASEAKYYEFTLQRVPSTGGDVVLAIAEEGGQVRQYALRVAGEPYTTCRMKEHGLKVEGGRLTGPMQILVGAGTEKIDMDVGLYTDGTYMLAYGCPDPPRKAQGTVSVEGPRDAASNRWVLWLDDVPKPDSRLGLPFELDRANRKLTALPAMAQGYNRGSHPVDASGVSFDGTNMEGEVCVTIVPARASKWLDAYVPAHRQPVEVSIRMTASIDGRQRSGKYSAVLGVERQRKGQVSVRQVSETQWRTLTASVITPQTPWRVWFVTGPAIVKGTNNQVSVAAKGVNYDARTAQLSTLPPANWSERDYDDSLWCRYTDELFESMGGYGVAVDNAALLCLRTRFGVSDVALATDAKVTVEYLGGAIVYVNGVEVGRSNLPDGRIEAYTVATDYPVEAYTTDDGVTPLPASAGNAQMQTNLLPRYQARVRTLMVSVPARVLVKGANVLAVELHRAPVCGPMASKGGWSHLGIRDVRVTSTKGSGLIGFAEAVKGVRVWSAQAVEQITETRVPKFRIPGGWSDQSREVYEPRGKSLSGIAIGNPYDPVLPVRILVPRNGVGNGQTVLSDPDGLHEVSASLGGMNGPGGAVLPASAARVRFAAQGTGFHWCDDLLEKPVDGAKTLPVWLQVQAPKSQEPGWYVSTLSLKANGKAFRIPVQVFVTGFTLPDARDLRSLMGVMHSPDAMADAYQVEPWSDEHFKLMARSLEMAGQLGNDIMYVPVIVGTHMGHRTGLVRWVKTGDSLRPDFGAFEKYLDLYVKYCAPPRAIVLYVWSPETVKEVADAYEGRHIPTREWTPTRRLQVTQWDPQTGVTTNVTVPTIVEEGADSFWKPLLDGVHASVVKRGWSERVIMVGTGSDIRPSQKTGELLRQWAPYARWDIYSHFSGDPGVSGTPGPMYRGPALEGSAPGKLIAIGNLEVGLKEHPWGDDSVWLTDYDFLDITLQRAWFYDQSPPMAFRTVPMLSGRLARLGLDFWRDNVRYSALIWGIYPIRIAGRGADGPLPTVRFEMLREAIQDFEARLTIIERSAKLPAEAQKPCRDLLAGLRRRIWTGNCCLSQTELNLDLPGYVAQMYRAAEELSGTKSEARWDRPPK